MKLRPLNSVLRSTGARGLIMRSTAMLSMTSPADSQIAAQTLKIRVGLNATRMPPSAGPATIAACDAEVEPATARGSISADTIFGNTACTLGCSKARPVPTTKAMARRRSGERSPIALAMASTPTASASIISPKKVTIRRS